MNEKNGRLLRCVLSGKLRHPENASVLPFPVQSQKLLSFMPGRVAWGAQSEGSEGGSREARIVQVLCGHLRHLLLDYSR